MYLNLFIHIMYIYKISFMIKQENQHKLYTHNHYKLCSLLWFYYSERIHVTPVQNIYKKGFIISYLFLSTMYNATSKNSYNNSI